LPRGRAVSFRVDVHVAGIDDFETCARAPRPGRSRRTQQTGAMPVSPDARRAPARPLQRLLEGLL